MKPLLCIMSPRDIPQCIKACDAINYVDKYWIKYHTEREALTEATRFFKEHTEYSHIIIASDDSVPDYNLIAKLMADFNAHPELEVISAVIGINYFEEDDRLSATIEQPVPNDEFRYSPLNSLFKLLPYEFTSTQGLLRVWFQGFGFTMMTRRVLEQVGLKTWYDNRSEMMSDLKFSLECAKAKIPQYVDLRTFTWHYRHRKDGNVEDRPEYEVLNSGRKGTVKSTKLVLAIASVPVEEPARILTEEDLKGPMAVYNSWYR